ncbi:MAG: hypothetical protein JNN07_27515 [Verrucomicrobiales bacterium]|nr:hypothetical protein [Verrucomicrobiales bacterium]
MSLLQSLLQDPAPMDVYIALRDDGAMGSGVEADPWNGGLQNSVEYSLSAGGFSVDKVTSAPSTIVTVTLTNHPFLTNDIVLIKGIEGGDGELYNGSFIVTKLGANSFKYTVLSVAPGNTQPTGSPTGSNIKCQLDPYRFDALMRSLPTDKPVTVHLGPGVFLTKGYEETFRGQVSWKPFSGLKIRGSGMALTTLKLASATYRYLHYYVVGMPGLFSSSPVLENFEITECSIDCDISNQPAQNITCGAVFIRGSYTLVRRVRCINFGRQGVPAYTPECFVINVGGASYQNAGGKYITQGCVVEECMIESPGLNNVKEATLINTAGGDTPANATSGFLFARSIGTVIRNNYINCEYQTNPVAIASITKGIFSGGSVEMTVITSNPHGLSAGKFVRIAGVAVTSGAPAGDIYNNPYNGSFAVTSSSGLYQFKYETEVASDPTSPDVIQLGLWVGRFSSHYVNISSLAGLTNPSGTVWQMTVTTATPHFLIPWDRLTAPSPVPGSVVVISGFSVASNLNGVWYVDSRSTAKSFVCSRDYSGGSPPSIAGSIGDGIIGIRLQGVGDGAIVEGNQIRNCTFGGPYIDTYGVPEIVIRNNLYSGVRRGPFQSLEQPVGTVVSQRITLTWVSRTSGTLVTFTTKSGLPHGLGVGQGLLVQDTKNSLGGLIDEYNRSFKVFEVISATNFTIVLDAVPLTDPDNSKTPTISMEYLWETVRCVVEKNVIELVPGVKGAGGASHGINFDGTIPARYFNSPPWPPANRVFWRFRQIEVRNNTIRYASDAFGNPLPGDAVYESAVSNVLAQTARVFDNIVDIKLDAAPDTPLKHLNCGSVTYFNNRTSAGELVQGWLQGSVQRLPELSTLIDDALTMSFL